MSESQSLERPRFFAGKLLTPEELTLEQEYFREKLRRHNRTLHGFGIIAGLKVITDSNQIVVDPGIALDCEGNEVVIGTTQKLSVPLATESWHSAHLNVCYVETSGNPVPTPGAEEGSPLEASTIRESFEIVFDQENFNRSHRHVRGRWLACGEPHALTVAKLRRSSHGWRVDRRYRPPTIK